MKIRLKNQKSYVLISILPKWADQILSGAKKMGVSQSSNKC